MKVELRRFNDNGKVVVVGTISESSDGGLFGDTAIAKNVLEDKFYDQGKKLHLTANDGAVFLEVLHESLHSPYLWATKPM